MVAPNPSPHSPYDPTERIGDILARIRGAGELVLEQNGQVIATISLPAVRQERSNASMAFEMLAEVASRSTTNGDSLKSMTEEGRA